MKLTKFSFVKLREVGWSEQTVAKSGQQTTKNLRRIDGKKAGSP
jgi:hypothetical protein